MKKLIVKDIGACEQCLSCEMACSKAFYKEYRQEYSCIRIQTNRLGEDVINVCTQCGKCAQVCPKYAITRNAKGVYVIDKKLCVGCMACVDICPTNVICKSMEQTYASKCIACGICVKACPQDILAIEDC